MEYSMTGVQAKAIDEDTIHRVGIPQLVLMERAALSVADAVCGLCSQETETVKRPSIWVACGMGNNGADGIAAGRILKERGFEVSIILAGNPEHATEAHRRQQRIARELAVPMVSFPAFPNGDCGIIIDALFGVGLSREVRGDYRDLIEKLAQLAKGGAGVVAVDIPSGICADTGAVLGTALKADHTVTFGYRKNGLLLYPGRHYAGKVQTADIGLTRICGGMAAEYAKVLEPADLRQLPVRRPDGNKGTFGRVLLAAGSEGMSGAAYLSALSAYRMGAGLVKILTVEANRVILQSQIPEAIAAFYDPQRMEDFTADIRAQCDWADVVVIGPGLGQQSYVEALVETVLAYSHVPAVIDADALNAIAKQSRLTRYLTKDMVLTPHIGEMSRLTGTTPEELKADPVRAACGYSKKTGAVCVLKDAATVVAGSAGEVYINASGCNAMAKAGSGDVLSGIIGALIAQGMETVSAAAYGVYIHGLAGEAAAEALGNRCVLAHEIADHITAVLPFSGHC